MKKGLLVVSIIAVVVAVLGLAGYAVAQARGMFMNRNVVVMRIPDADRLEIWKDFRGNNRGMIPMVPNWKGMQGSMHPYLLDAVAKALDMTPEDLQNQLVKGSSLWQIAQEKGMTVEQFKAAMQTGWSEALKQAVVDGVLTQAQADWMSSHMQNWDEFGPIFPGMGPGGRMNRNRP